MEVTNGPPHKRGVSWKLSHTKNKSTRLGGRVKGLYLGLPDYKLSALNTPLHCLHDVHNKAMYTEIYHKEFHTWIFYT